MFASAELHSNRSRRCWCLLSSLVISVLLSASIGFAETTDLKEAPAVQSAETYGPPAPSSHLIVTTGTIGNGDSVYESLTEQGISPQTVYQIANELAPYFNFRRSRPGHWYRLMQDSDGKVIEFFYGVSSLEGYQLRREGDRFVC